jgi:hypothetical protein
LAESNSGNQLGSSGFNGTNSNSYAFATEAPNSSLVTSILNANSNLETALGNGAVFGLATAAPFSSTATIAWTLDTTALSGHLIAGLINDQSFGNGNGPLDFNVVENGTTIFDKTFTTLAPPRHSSPTMASISARSPADQTRSLISTSASVEVKRASARNSCSAPRPRAATSRR